MTTQYHTPIAVGASNAPGTVNTPLGTLDAQIVANTGAITTHTTQIATLNTNNAPSVWAQINNAAGEADTSWIIDNISGTFLDGATVTYVVSGKVYTSEVAANTGSTPLTVTANPAVTLPDDTPIVQVPPGLAPLLMLRLYNVMDPAYGAVGDNSTDDTTAIQNALNAAAAANGILVFPAATYKITAALTYTSGTRFTILGLGKARLNQTTANTQAIKLTDCTHVLIENLEVDGAGTASGSAGANEIGIDVTESTTSEWITIRNCYVENFGRIGISSAADYTNISDCRVIGDEPGVADADHVGIRVQGNYSSMTQNRVLGYSNGLNSAGVNNEGVMVSNNQVRNAAANDIGIYMSAGDYSSVVGNHISLTSGQGVKVANGSQNPIIAHNTIKNGGIRVERVQGACVVEGNTLENGQLLLQAATTGDNPRSRVVNNVINNSSGDGIELRGNRHLIMGNLIDSPQHNGIVITSGDNTVNVEDIIISNNHIFDVGQATTNTYSAIKFGESGTQLTYGYVGIHNNVLYSPGSGTRGKYGIEVLDADTTTITWDIQNNRISGFETGNLDTTGITDTEHSLVTHEQYVNYNLNGELVVVPATDASTRNQQKTIERNWSATTSQNYSEWTCLLEASGGSVAETVRVPVASGTDAVLIYDIYHLHDASNLAGYIRLHTVKQNNAMTTQSIYEDGGAEQTNASFSYADPAYSAGNVDLVVTKTGTCIVKVQVYVPSATVPAVSVVD